MGAPRAFQTDNGSEYTNRIFDEHCGGLGTHGELTAPLTPQQSGPVESALIKTHNAGLEALFTVNKLFGNECAPREGKGYVELSSDEIMARVGALGH